MRLLDGLRIVITRATHQAEELGALLRNEGAEVIYLPTVAIEPPPDPAPLREAAAQCDAYDWIVFTSANAVRAFAAELPGPRMTCRAHIAAIGASTAAEARAAGFSVSVTPEKYIAESLVDALGKEDLQGKRVLIPSAAVTRNVVPHALAELGASVEVVEAYRNVVPSGAASLAKEILRDPFPDWITFASSSALENLVALIGTEPLKSVPIASIGPITSASVRRHGLSVAAEAHVAGAEGILQAILRQSKPRTN